MINWERRNLLKNSGLTRLFIFVGNNENSLNVGIKILIAVWKQRCARRTTSNGDFVSGVKKLTCCNQLALNCSKRNQNHIKRKALATAFDHRWRLQRQMLETSMTRKPFPSRPYHCLHYALGLSNFLLESVFPLIFTLFLTLQVSYS